MLSAASKSYEIPLVMILNVFILYSTNFEFYTHYYINKLKKEKWTEFRVKRDSYSNTCHTNSNFVKANRALNKVMVKSFKTS